MRRCGWTKDKDFYNEYHDKEWGVPLHDDRALFELLVLEGAQAGLSWETVLRKRNSFRRAFDNFDARKVSKYDERKIEELLSNERIIRNRLKIEAAIQNAKMFLAAQKEFKTFDAYIWHFIGGTPKRNNWRALKDVPARTIESDEMSKDLRKRGFKFVGSTICYAFMQATGMVNDHITSCFRHEEIG